MTGVPFSLVANLRVGPVYYLVNSFRKNCFGVCLPSHPKYVGHSLHGKCYIRKIHYSASYELDTVAIYSLFNLLLSKR